MSVQIRETRDDDFDRVVELLKQLWPGKESNPIRLRQVFADMVASVHYELLCAEKDGLLVGFCSALICDSLWVEGAIMYITVIVVDEKLRNIGIGSSLMKRMEATAASKGCKKIELESAFLRDDAHRFYDKMGFQKRAWFFTKDVA